MKTNLELKLWQVIASIAMQTIIILALLEYLM